MIKLGVIFGGPTVEHEVSIISAVQAMNSLNKEKYDVYPIYVSKDRTWYTGHMLTDIDMYRDFDNLKRFAKKVVLFNKDGKLTIAKKEIGLKKAINSITNDFKNFNCFCSFSFAQAFISFAVVSVIGIVLFE